jgi:streptogramin lyase
VPKTDQGPLAASTGGQVWTRGIGPSTLVQVDPTSQAVRLETTLPFVIDDTTFILATDTYVWVSFWADDSVVKVSSSTGEVLSTTSLPKPKGAVLAGGSLWVSLARNDAVARLDPESMALLAEIPLGTAKDSPVCGGCVTWMFSSRDSVWAISTSPGQVTRLEASSGRVVGTLQLPGKLLAGFDAAPNGDVWVTVTPPGTLHGDLVRIDYETILEAERIGLGEGRGTLDGVSPQGIRELNGTLWVSTEQGEMIPVRANP